MEKCQLNEHKILSVGVNIKVQHLLQREALAGCLEETKSEKVTAVCIYFHSFIAVSRAKVKLQPSWTPQRVDAMDELFFIQNDALLFCNLREDIDYGIFFGVQRVWFIIIDIAKTISHSVSSVLIP